MSRHRYTLGLILVAMMGVAPSTTLAAAPTWHGEVFASAGVCPDSAPDVATGGVHLAWLANGWLRYAHLDGSGQVVADESVVDGEDGEWSFGPGIDAATDGSVWLAHKRRVADWTYDGLVSHRTIGGWGEPVVLFENQRAGWAPVVAADPAGGSVVFEIPDSSGDVWGTTHHWLLQPTGVEHEHGGALFTRADDRISLVAGPAQGERHVFAGTFPYHADSSGIIAYSWSLDAGASWSDAVEVQSPTCIGEEAWLAQPDAALAGLLHELSVSVQNPLDMH